MVESIQALGEMIRLLWRLCAKMAQVAEFLGLPQAKSFREWIESEPWWNT